MHRVYGVRLDLGRSGVKHGHDELAEVAQKVWSWAVIEPRPVDAWEDGSYHLGTRTIIAFHEASGENELYRLTMRHPDAVDPGLEWRTVVDATLCQGQMEFGCSIDQNTVSDQVSPRRTHPGTPRIVRTLIQDGARAGRHKLSARALLVAGRDKTEEFVEGWLLDPNRRLPIVVLTSTRESDDKYAVDIEEIDRFSTGCAGVAHVFCVPRNDTFEITSRLGRNLAVFDGAMRVYWPGLGFEQATRHRLYPPHQINAFTLNALRNEMVYAAARHYVQPGVVAELLVEKRRRAERERIEEAETGTELATLYAADLDASQAEAEQLASELDRKDLEIFALEDRLKEANEKVRILQYQLRQKGGDTAVIEETEAPEPHTFEDAILFASQRFRTTLVMTEAAEKSALKMNSADNSVEKLWRALTCMDDVASRWQAEDLPKGGIPVAFREQNFHVGRVSPLVLSRHEQAYGFTHKGERVSVNPHIELSRGERIYWYEDADDRMLVINHIGAHLPDSTTG